MKRKLILLFSFLLGAMVSSAAYTVGKVYDYDGSYLNDCRGRVSVGSRLAIPVVGLTAQSLVGFEHETVLVRPKTFAGIGAVSVYDDYDMADMCGWENPIWDEMSAHRAWIVVELLAAVPTKGTKTIALELAQRPWEASSPFEEKTVSFTLVWSASEPASAADYDVCWDCGSYPVSTGRVEPTFWASGCSETIYCPECGKVLSLGATLPPIDECWVEAQEERETSHWLWRDANRTVWRLEESSLGTGWALCSGEFVEKLPAALTLPSYFRGRPVVELASEFEFINDMEQSKDYALTIPGTVESIGEDALTHWDGSYDETGICITSVSIPPSVSYIGDGFCGMQYKLASVDCKARGYQVDAGGLYRLEDMTLLTAFPSTRTQFTIRPGTRRIGDCALSYLSKLTSVDIPNSVESVGESAFESCTALTTISVPASVREIGAYAFWECSKLTTAYLSAEVSSLPIGLFGNCEALTSVYLPASLEKIPLGVDGEEDWVTYLGTPFMGCTKLREVRFNGPAPRVVLRDYWGEETDDDWHLFKTPVWESYWDPELGAWIADHMTLDDLPVTVYAVTGTDGWGDEDVWQQRPLVFSRREWGDPNRKYDVVLNAPSSGSVAVSGYGSYMAGSKVTIVATTTEKGAVFDGWYDAGGMRVASTASYTFVMPASDVEYSASFVLPSEDYLRMETEWEALEMFPGQPVEWIVGRYESRSEVSVKATGLPPGLSLTAAEGTLAISGWLSATAKFSSGWMTVELSNKTGYRQSGFVPYMVGYADYPEAARGDYWVGDRIEDECDAKSVSGLPTGLKFDAKAQKIRGIPTKPGVYTIKYTYGPGEVESYTVIAEDPGSRYLSVDVAEGLGTASGSGVYAAGTTVKLAAKPDKGYYFAGWYGDGSPFNELASGDYRTANDTLVVGSGCPGALSARFVSADVDREPFFEDWDGWRWTVDDYDGVFGFGIFSVTKPTVTVKNLPAGIKFVATGEGGFLSVSDPQKLKPGVYAVQLSLKNLSGATAAQTLEIEVPNLRNPYFWVDDMEFEPGVDVKLLGGISFWETYRELLRYDPTATFAVSGLPKGLSYDAKGFLVKGAPTVPGHYTVTFTAKGKEIGSAVATATYTVRPFPALVVTIPEDLAEIGGAVTGSGNYLPGSKVTLKATVPRGYVFAGWKASDESFYVTYSEVQRKQNPFTYTAQEENPEIWPEFIYIGDDWCWVEGLFQGDDNDWVELPLYDDVNRAVGVSSGSTITSLKASGLPKGLKFDAKTGRITGQPTTRGIYHVTVEAKNASGYQHSAVFIVDVGGVPVPLNGCLPGTPNGGDIDLQLQFKQDAHPEFAGMATGYDVWGDLYPDIVEAVEADRRYWGDVTGIKASGLPPGVTLQNGGVICGMPTKAGLYTMTLDVTLSSKQKLKYQYSFIVRDSGSAFLDIFTDGPDPKVTGYGVYPVGTTVKLSATAPKGMVFAGWDVGEELTADYRKAANGLVLRGRTEGYAVFVDKEEDSYVGLGLESYGGDLEQTDDRMWRWRVDSENPGGLNLFIDSLSMPKVTVKGLPKGCVFNADWNEICFTAPPTTPGVYRVTLAIQNQSGAKTDGVIDIVVPNIRSDAFDGLMYEDPYVWTVGESDCCREPYGFSFNWGWTVTAAGLPAGIKLVSDSHEGFAQFVGAATKAGTYTVTLTAKWGRETKIATVTMVVNPLPTWAVGRFNGVLGDPESPDGLFTLDATAAGKLTATLTFNNGTKKSFTTTGWEHVDGEGASAAFLDGKSCGVCTPQYGLTLYLSAYAAWNGWQMSGEYDCSVGRGGLAAQRNPFGKAGSVYENPEAHDIAARLAAYGKMGAYVLRGANWGTYELVCAACLDRPMSAPDVTVTVGQDGTVKFAGKIGTLSLSGSAPLLVTEDGLGAILQSGPKTAPYLINLRLDPDGGAAGAVSGTIRQADIR